MSTQPLNVTSTSNGEEGCKCVDMSSTLASLTERACTFTSPDGDVQKGVLLTANAGTCVPFSYGSNECLQYDKMYDLRCHIGVLLGRVPSYCKESWCYVDRELCKHSNEMLYRSDFFSHDEANLYYSYSTCNSSAEEWLSMTKQVTSDVLEGVSIYTGVPGLREPNLFKTTVDGEITTERGEEYYNDNIPYEGLYIDYLKKLMQISKGDIGNFTYTHGSGGSRQLHPSSSYTAMVQDIQNELVDMGVGPFWVTGERLKMSSFTIPLLYDKTVLVVPKPGSTYSLSYESSKVFEPFTWGLWGCILIVIIVSSLLSVWFSDRDAFARRRYGQSITGIRKQKKYIRWSTYCRLALDAFLQKGIFFFSAGVEQDGGASLPHNLLMFGFAFFILIAVSAYVANLASFLTQQKEITSVVTMEGAVAYSAPICAHPVLEQELISKWPDAHFVFDRSGNGWDGVFDLYEAKKCSVLAVGRNDNILDMERIGRLCANDLVFTDSLIVETPIALPIRSDLASGLSYWIHYAERYKNFSFKRIQEEYLEKVSSGLTCVTELSQVSQEEVDEFAQISPANMILPIISFVAFALGAMLLQMYHEYFKKKGGTLGTLVGRTSALDLFSSERETNPAMERLKIVGNAFARKDDGRNSDSSFHEEVVVDNTVDLTIRNSSSLNKVPEDFPVVHLSLYKNTDGSRTKLKDAITNESESPSSNDDTNSDAPGTNLHESPSIASKKDETSYKIDIDLGSPSCSEGNPITRNPSSPNVGDYELGPINQKGLPNSSDAEDNDLSSSTSQHEEEECNSGKMRNHLSSRCFSPPNDGLDLTNGQIEQLVENCREMIEFFQGMKKSKKVQ